MTTSGSQYTNPIATGAEVQDPTTYKANIDACINSAWRLAGNFFPCQSSTANMKVAIGPGHLNTGSGSLIEIGAVVKATLNSTTTAALEVATGLSGTMMVTGRGIPTGTTATFSGLNATLSAAATITASNVPLTFYQISSTFTAPVSNPRIDRIVGDKDTGIISIVAGTEAITPTPPVIPFGKFPICQVKLQTSSTTITNSMIYDERDFSFLNGFAYLKFLGEPTVASATTCDIGVAESNKVLISGTTTITGFGTATNQFKVIRFSGVLVLTHNATSLILPNNGANITTEAGDVAIACSDASGNWRIYAYHRASGAPLDEVKGADKASASTVDLSTTTGDFVDITGTTTITSFGTVPAGREKVIRFTGALTLTHNATSLILPGATNITTAANDRATLRSLGSGNWICTQYTKADGTSIASVSKKAKYTNRQASGTGGGSTTAGSWLARVLNTEDYDDIGISLASNTLTLPAGTYYISAFALYWCTNFGAAACKLKIRNTTLGTDIALGMTAILSTANGANNTAILDREKIVLATTTDIQLQYYTDVSVATIGQGNLYNAPGTQEIYTSLTLEKVI